MFRLSLFHFYFWYRTVFPIKLNAGSNIQATRPGVNFINILWATFTCADPKSAKRQSSCQSFLQFLGYWRAKAACKTLMKLTQAQRSKIDFLDALIRQKNSTHLNVSQLWRQSQTSVASPNIWGRISSNIFSQLFRALSNWEAFFGTKGLMNAIQISQMANIVWQKS